MKKLLLLILIAKSAIGRGRGPVRLNACTGLPATACSLTQKESNWKSCGQAWYNPSTAVCVNNVIKAPCLELPTNTCSLTQKSGWQQCEKAWYNPSTAVCVNNVINNKPCSEYNCNIKFWAAVNACNQNECSGAYSCHQKCYRTAITQYPDEWVGKKCCNTRGDLQTYLSWNTGATYSYSMFQGLPAWNP